MKDEYLNYLEAVRGLSEHTRLAYGRDLDAWEAFLADRGTGLDAATKAQAGEFLRHLGKHGLSPRSVNRVLSCLRGFYRYLLRTGRATAHPFSGIRSLKTPRRLPVFLFEKEVQTLLTEDRPGFQGIRDRLLFEVLYSTGCRVSEVCALDLATVVGKSKFPVLGKGNKTRSVFLTPSAQKALTDYLPARLDRLAREDADAAKALFLNSRGTRLGVRGVQKIVDRAATRAGLTKDATPHTLRHTFATHLSAEGMDVRVVQELLGHSRLETTQVYTHLSLDRLKDVVRAAHPHG
ncbi:MAG TPA: tyrosine-type recombinase/integrase [Spirochaetia bacterium]|jgi:site-specific recombinase XerD|nr:tyrosine-type recombinase/integrase [Spirochaetia bacterium]